MDRAALQKRAELQSAKKSDPDEIGVKVLEIENTTEKPIKINSALVFAPGLNKLTPEQIKAWFALRNNVDTSKKRIKDSIPRWPPFLQTILYAKKLVVKKCSAGVDEKAAERAKKRGDTPEKRAAHKKAMQEQARKAQAAAEGDEPKVETPKADSTKGKGGKADPKK